MSSLTIWRPTAVTAEVFDHEPPAASRSFTSLTLKIPTDEHVPPFGYFEIRLLEVPPALAHALAAAINGVADARVKDAAE